MQETAMLTHRHHGKRIGATGRAQRGALKRVERNVNPRPLAGADFFTDIKHGRFVALALADYHRAVDRHAVQRFAHRVHGCLVGVFLKAPSRPMRTRQRGGFGHPHGFECKITIHDPAFTRSIIVEGGLGHVFLRNELKN